MNCGCGTHGPYTRRHFLFGGIGTLSTALLRTPSDAAQSSANPIPRATAKACIFVNLSGGPSHLDTFDPKDGPWNPRDADIRQYPGNIILSRRFFPMLSDMTEHLCILRSVTSWEAAHSRGQFYIQTGHSFNPAFAPALPHIGAVVSYELGGKGPLPPYFSPNPAGDEQRHGFLPGRNAPFSFSPQANGLNNLRHDFYGNQSLAFFENAYNLLQTLEEPLRSQPLSDDMAAYSAMLGQARALVYNPAVSPLLQFTSADEARYGGGNFARSLIVARNLVRSKLGTVFVSVTHNGWDQHARQFDTGNGQNIYRLTNELDRGLANLIADLRATGDLSSTLIVAIGEFGRTPGLLNNRDGRDHYRNVMSVLLAGGGVRGGRAIGVTDATGSVIDDFGWSRQRVIYVEDIASTIYSALGIDWTKSIENTPLGRRYIYVVGAETGAYGPVEEVFA